MKKLTLLVIILAVLVASSGCTPDIKDPVDGGAKEVLINPVDKVNVDNLSLLDEFAIDFDNDGIEEKIGMYTSAQKDSNGEVMWDDGQNWLFIVQDTDKDYVLVDEYVQLGSIDFNIYTIEDDFYISTYSSRTASLTLNLYHYDRVNDNFEMTTPYNAPGNVNMLKTSYGY